MHDTLALSFLSIVTVIDTARIGSVCTIDRQQQRRAAGLLLGAPRVGDKHR